MSPKKHSKQKKRDIGKGKPTERKAIKGYTKGVVGQLTARLHYSPEPKEELREMVIDAVDGETYIEDLVQAAKNAGMTGELNSLLLEYRGVRIVGKR